MITKEQAMALWPGAILHQIEGTNADGTPVRWRVNGKCKTWKRSPERFQIPLKHGLYDYGYLTEKNAHLLVVAD